MIDAEKIRGYRKAGLTFDEIAAREDASVDDIVASFEFKSIGCRVSELEHREILRVARRRGQTLAEFLRVAIQREVAE